MQTILNSSCYEYGVPIKSLVPQSGDKKSQFITISRILSLRMKAWEEEHCMIHPLTVCSINELYGADVK